ncbi:MAG: serine/threonine protein kinase [Candidatus Zixiibacteriota bacterium]
MASDDFIKLAARINELAQWHFTGIPKIVTDTSDCMRIQRGNIIRLGDRDFVVEGNKYETRFGISDQPKYWVFGAIDLENGQKKIIKTVFHEEFNVHIGVFKIRCYRSPEKEAEVLKLVAGDDRFMQGYTIPDTKNNCIRIIDFIKGKSIFQYVYYIDKNHERYFYEDLPGILRNLLSCMEAIQFLHDNNTCHGDIRNDHILIEPISGKYRWIDFDLNQHVSDFDVWSMGNIINYVAGKGINSFHSVMKSREYSDKVKSSLKSDDGSAFYEYRVINLKKLFPYMPDRLNKILMHFSIKPQGSYENMRQLIEDYREMLEADFPSG